MCVCVWLCVYVNACSCAAHASLCICLCPCFCWVQLASPAPGPVAPSSSKTISFLNMDAVPGYVFTGPAYSNGYTLMVPDPDTLKSLYSNLFLGLADDYTEHGEDIKCSKAINTNTFAYAGVANALFGWDAAAGSLSWWKNGYIAPPLKATPAVEALATAAASAAPVPFALVGQAVLEYIADAAEPYGVTAQAIAVNGVPKGDALTERLHFEQRLDNGNVALLLEPTYVVLDRLLSIANAALAARTSSPSSSPTSSVAVTALILLRVQLVDLISRGGLAALEPSFLALYPSAYSETKLNPSYYGEQASYQQPLAEEKGKLTILLAHLRALLLSIIQSNTSTAPADIALADTASRVLVGGLSLFYPSGPEQVGLLTSLLQSGSALSPAEMSLLRTLMKTLSGLPSALALVNNLLAAEAQQGSGASPLVDLMTSLLNIAARETYDALSAAVSGATAVAPPTSSTNALLEALVKCSLSALSTSVKARTPLPASLLRTVDVIVATCTKLLEAGKAALEGDDVSAAAMGVHDALAASPVGAVLPLVVASLTSAGSAFGDILSDVSLPRGPVTVVGSSGGPLEVTPSFADLFTATSALWSAVAAAGCAEFHMVTVKVASQDTVIIESPHPYNNSMDVYQVRVGGV